MDAFVDPLALLSLQMDWGADEALADAPINRMAGTPPVPARATLGAALGEARHPHTVPQARPPANAGSPSVVATTMEELRAAIRGFTGCALRDTATNPVLVEGNADGGLLVIGEPPVAEDDRSGRPFSGLAGAVLDRILAAIGLDREKILLAPLIPWRPPGSRPPTDAELAQCIPLLNSLIVLTQPRRIMLTGILPVRALLGSGVTLRRSRGQWMDLTIPGLNGAIPALASAGLGNLKSAADRRAVWADWRLLHRSIHLKS